MPVELRNLQLYVLYFQSEVLQSTLEFLQGKRPSTHQDTVLLHGKVVHRRLEGSWKKWATTSDRKILIESTDIRLLRFKY